MKARSIISASGISSLVLLGTACSRISIDVNAYLAPSPRFPSADSGASIAIVPETIPAEPLLDRELESKIAYLLRDRGYDIADRKSCDYLLFATAAIDAGTTGVDYMPVTRGGEVIYTRAYTSRRRWVRFHTYQPYRTAYVPYTYTVYHRSLSLTLAKRDLLPEVAATQSTDPPDEDGDHVDQAVVWRCVAESVGAGTDLRWLINHLLLASFDYFGADTGKAARVKMQENDDRVMHLAETLRNAGREG